MLRKLKHLFKCPPYEYYKYSDENSDTVVFRTCPVCGIMQEKITVKRPVPFTQKRNDEFVMGNWITWKDIH